MKPCKSLKTILNRRGKKEQKDKNIRNRLNKTQKYTGLGFRVYKESPEEVALNLGYPYRVSFAV